MEWIWLKKILGGTSNSCCAVWTIYQQSCSQLQMKQVVRQCSDYLLLYYLKSHFTFDFPFCSQPGVKSEPGFIPEPLYCIPKSWLEHLSQGFVFLSSRMNINPSQEEAMLLCTELPLALRLFRGWDPVPFVCRKDVRLALLLSAIDSCRCLAVKNYQPFWKSTGAN